MTISISISDTVESADINLDVGIDPSDSDALIVSYNGQPLPSRDSLLVDCLVGQKINLIIADFTDTAGLSWMVDAEPLVRATSSGTTWQRNGTTAVDSDAIAWPHGDAFVPVEVQGSPSSGTATRRRTIHVKLLTSNPGPGGL